MTITAAELSALEPGTSFADLSQDDKMQLLYQSQVNVENKLDEILTVMKQIADAANNFAESIPPPLKAMLGL